MVSPAADELIFGVRVRDPFRWLEDGDDPRVVAWVEQQDRESRRVLQGLPDREALQARLEELIYVEQRSVPVLRGGRLFYSVKPPDREKAIHYYSDGKGGTPRVLLDPNAMSPDGSLSIGGVYPTRDGKLVGYLEKPNNADKSTLRIMDVDSLRMLAGDSIDGLRFTAPSWLPDGSGFFYTWTPSDEAIPLEELLAHAEVRLHRLGTSPAGDEVVFPASGDASKSVGASVSADGAYLFVHVHHGWSRSEVYVRFLGRGETAWRPLATGRDAVYAVEAHEGVFYVMTNEDAPRYRVFRVDPEHLDRESWHELIPEDRASVIEEMGVVGGHLVLRRLHNAYTELEVRRLDGSLLRTVSLPGIGTASMLSGEPDRDEAFFSFASFTHPNEIHETSIGSGRTTLLSRVSVDIVPEDYAVEQVWYPSKDGTRISMFIIRKKGLALDGRNPTLLYGYGGFNISMVPAFSASLFPWLERGGVYAVPNLRGGGEYGEAWHRAGMLENKQNVFDDFIAAAEYLIARGYASSSTLAAAGGSNGGLLVGAVMTQRPELFRAVVCSVPVLDMLRFHKVGIGKAWVPEYGDPEREEHFRFLYQYSPYHRLVRGTQYPSLLVLSADSDDRVDPLHARKFAARVAEASTRRDYRVLLRVEQNAGHGGADLRRQAVAMMADEYAFLRAVLVPDGDP